VPFPGNKHVNRYIIVNLVGTIALEGIMNALQTHKSDFADVKLAFLETQPRGQGNNSTNLCLMFCAAYQLTLWGIPIEFRKVSKKDIAEFVGQDPSYGERKQAAVEAVEKLLREGTKFPKDKEKWVEFFQGFEKKDDFAEALLFACLMPK
jgi:hypothetical protein